MFWNKYVLINFGIFTGKHLCWSLFLIKLQAWSDLLRKDSNFGVFLLILWHLRIPNLKKTCNYFFRTKFGYSINEARYRSSHRMCSVKKVFLEMSQNSQENTCARVSENFAKFLRTPFLQNTSGATASEVNQWIFNK